MATTIEVEHDIQHTSRSIAEIVENWFDPGRLRCMQWGNEICEDRHGLV